MILMTVHLIGQEINDNDKKVWDKLTDSEKWESYKIAHNSYLRLKDLYDKKNDSINMLSDDLEKTNKLLKSKYPDNGIGVQILAGLDYKLGVDCYAVLFYKKYIFYDKVYFQAGLGFKFYDTYGGGVNLGLGFNF